MKNMDSVAESSEELEDRGSASERRKPDAGGISRRTFAIGLGSTLALIGLGAGRYVGSVPVVRPPGGQDEIALVSKCVHCYRCMEACPFHLIVPSSIEQGILGMRTPRMKFSDNDPGVLDALKYCDFCARENGGVPLCAQVCPSDALDPGASFDSATAVIGVARLDENLCLAYRGARCAFCYDACRQVRGDDAAAIYYENAETADGTSLLPLVDHAKCNGCGACESVCVSAQAGSTRNASVRAIVIDPLES